MWDLYSDDDPDTAMRQLEMGQLELPPDDRGLSLHDLVTSGGSPRRLLARAQKTRCVMADFNMATAAAAAAAAAGAAAPPEGLSVAKDSCCRLRCVEKLAEHPELCKIQRMFKTLDNADQRQWLFNELAVLVGSQQPRGGCDPTESTDGGQAGCATGVAEGSGVSTSQRRPDGFWRLGGRPVCFASFCALLGVGQGRVRTVLASVEKGNQPCPSEDQRIYNKGRDPVASRNVDAFLEFAYQHLAEPLADVEDTKASKASKPDYDSDGVVLPSDGEEMEDLLMKDKEIRYLPPEASTISSTPTSFSSAMTDLPVNRLSAAPWNAGRRC